MKYLTADEILSFDDTLYTEVECPEWTPKGEKEVAKVRIRSMTTETGLAFAEALADEKPQFEVMIIAVADGVVDENGEPIFSRESIKGLAKKNIKPVQRIFNAISELSKPDVDEIEKN